MLKPSAKLVRAFAAILGIIGMVSHRVAANDGRIDFQLDAPRQVSLGIYDAKGTQVRTLLSGGNLEAGKQSVQWDGLDRNGIAVAPGEYAWRLLASEGLKAEWVMGLGTSTAWPAYEEWVGNHDGPRAVALDAEGNTFVGAGSGEGTSVLLKMSADGKRRLWSIGQLEVAEGPHGSR